MRIVIILILMGFIGSLAAEERGIIGKMTEDGHPVIYSLDNFIPKQKIIDEFPTLVVVKWAYDGAGNNGMPSKKLQKQIYLLDELLEQLVKDGLAFRAYARTGNDLREYVYYCIDQASFLQGLNQVTEPYPRFPIDIVFYNDPSWSDYKKLISAFNE